MNRMQTLEGFLSKWTNVIKGWQYRWFVLDEQTGLLSYYTSKENMSKGERRGCIRLKDAHVGYDDEDDVTFTIKVNDKTFHLQAKNLDEREKWVSKIEESIRFYENDTKVELNQNLDCKKFDANIIETDAYLQIIMDQVKVLEEKRDKCASEPDTQNIKNLIESSTKFVDTVKNTIVALQIAKHNTIEAATQQQQQQQQQEQIQSKALDYNYHKTLNNNNDNITQMQREQQQLNLNESQVKQRNVSSTFSSDDEDFYDAVDSTSNGDTISFKQQIAHTSSHVLTKSNAREAFDDDSLYDNVIDENEELNLDNQQNVITHLLSQVRVGMDLSKITLPTFILERRSLLEMYADFFAHVDLFTQIPQIDNPRDRMIQVVKWYLSAFHSGRKTPVAKKPYNPILGELFQCLYRIPGETFDSTRVLDGPVPWATRDQATLIAEQVSHHPPISAFYAEHYNRRIQLDGYIWTKSKFLGLSIGVHMVGKAVLSLLDRDEEYILTFPSAYGRSILTVPWFEMGGLVTITCPKTAYHTEIEFLTKPFYSSKKNQIQGSIYGPDKKVLYTLDGEWNGVMYIKSGKRPSEIFVNTHSDIIKKQVRPIAQQEEYESRRLWREVTYYLKNKQINNATMAKQKIEQAQRDDAKYRRENNEKWKTKYFTEQGENWIYINPLVKRLQQDKLK